jgi:hypothetical protein
MILSEESKLLEINGNKTGELRNKIDLMNELLENESPISPYGYFSITVGTLLVSTNTYHNLFNCTYSI